MKDTLESLTLDTQFLSASLLPLGLLLGLVCALFL